MLGSVEWEGAERFIEGEFDRTANRLSQSHGLESGFTREQVSDLYRVLRRGAGVDRIAWATARDQRDDFIYMREHGLSMPTLTESTQEFSAWRDEISQVEPYIGGLTDYQYREFRPQGGGPLIVARFSLEGKVGDITLGLFYTTAVGKSGYIRERAVDVLKGGVLVATVDGNRAEEQSHIHITGEDAEKPWHYLNPPTMLEVVQDSIQVAHNPSYPQMSGKFVQRAA